jgi:hypothetical protein
MIFLAKAEVCVRQRLCWLCGMLGTGGEFCGGGWCVRGREVAWWEVGFVHISVMKHGSVCIPLLSRIVLLVNT